jgi:hypothetical protein
VKQWLLGLTSRKLLVALLGSAFTACNYILGWGLSEGQIGLILAPLGTYILAEGAKDTAAAHAGSDNGISLNTTKIQQTFADEDEDYASQRIVAGRLDA